jgi:hypothetical protein
MAVKPRKDAVKLVKKYLEEKFGLEVRKPPPDLRNAPGHLMIKPSGTVIHVKGIQQESVTKNNAYYPRSFNYLKQGHTQFLVLAIYNKNQIIDSFILPPKIVDKIFGGLSPDYKNRFVFTIKVENGRNKVKCHVAGGKPVDIEDYKNLWNLISDIRLNSHADLDELSKETMFDQGLRGKEPSSSTREYFDEDEIGYTTGERTRIPDINLRDFLQSVQLDNLSTFEPHYLRNPERAKINEIIHHCARGKWVLPKFQRYFRWRKNQVKEFLKSIFNDYYVGALLFWDVANEIQLDVIPVRGVDSKESSRATLIILDGQQRITSLYYAIKAPNFPLEGSSSPLYFYIDFASYFKQRDTDDSIEVLPWRLNREESLRKMLFPFYELEEYNKWTDDLEDFMIRNSTNSNDKIRKIRRLIEKKLLHIRDGFEIPYISLPESMELDKITDIFEKINTTGITLDVFDLLIARLSKYKIELKTIWEDITNRYPKFQKYQTTTNKMPYYILQAISLSYNNSCKRADILNIYGNVFEQKGIKFKETWYDMSDYVNKGISKLENLRDGFGISEENQLPFAPIIPILSALIKEQETKRNKADCNKKLSIWYWSSVFSNAYSGAVDTQLAADFKEMKMWFSDNKKVPKTVERARRDVGGLDLREVRSKTGAIYKGVLSLLALEGAKDFDTKGVLENAPNNDKDHLFPVKEFGNKHDINSVLNITWMSDETNRNIKRYEKPSAYIPKFIEDKYNNDKKEFQDVLNTHFINETTYEFMLKDDFEGFINERNKTVLSKIRRLIGIE